MADTTPLLPGRDRDPAPHLPRAAARRARGAAAAGVLLLLVLTSLVACGDDDDDDAAATTTTTEATSSTTETAPATTTTTAAPASDPADTARLWVDAIAAGNDATIVELVAPRSLEAFGGEQGVRDSEIALAEGWGAWAHSEDLELTSIRIDATTSVVVFHGTVSQEGPPEEGWAALPVVRVAAGDRVEPFLDLGNVEIHPDLGSAIERDQRFSAYVLGGRDVRMIIDAGEAVEPALQSADGDQQLAEYDVGGLEPGSHALTIVLFNDDGVMARTFEYVVPD